MTTRLLPHLLLASALLAVPAAASDVIRPGFQPAGSVQLPVLGTAYATLSDGRFFAFDGNQFELRARDGSLIASLGAPPIGNVYPSFAIVDPTETFAVVGESLNGFLYRVDLAGAGVTTITSIAYNYDAEFDLDPAWIWVSAATQGFGFGNDVLRVEIDTGVVVPRAHVDGASGPLALDAAGDLYYGDVSDAFCPEPGSASILKWDRAELLAGPLLDETDATVFSPGYDGALSLEFDPVSAHLFVAEVDFCSAIARIREMDESGARRAIVVESSSALGNLELFAGSGDATFQPYQRKNTVMKYNSTDFGAGTSTIVTLWPKRPSAVITGPSSGPAQMTLTITGAAPDGHVVVLFGSRTHHVPDEITYDLGYGFPVHFALPLPRIRRVGQPVPTDSTGTATFTYFDPGNLHGLLVFQGLVLDENAVPVGTSKAALN